jgi:hypothetical protein
MAGVGKGGGTGAEPAPRPGSPIKKSELVPAWQNNVWHRALEGAFVTSLLVAIVLSIFWFQDFDGDTDSSDLRVFAVIFTVLWPVFWVILARRKRRRARDSQRWG